MSKKWLRVRDSYGIEIRQGEGEPLLLARTVALDKLAGTKPAHDVRRAVL